MSRVGDELQERAEDSDSDQQGDAEQIEEDAYNEAQEKGWDKSLRDS